MAGKLIEVSWHSTIQQDCRLYSDALRKLFGLPKRLGRIVSVSLDGQTVHVYFESTRYKFINHKLTGGK
jgi:hypothetical protein